MIRVLLVDDSPVVLRTLKRTIPWEQYGMTVEGHAENGRLAIEFLKRNPVELVFTDIKMPHMDGIELIRKVHEFLPDTVFVVISSYSEFQLVRESFQYGAVDYLLKFDVDNHEVTDALLKKLQLLCEGKKTVPGAERLGSLWMKIGRNEEYLSACRFQLLDLLLKGNSVAVSDQLFSLKEQRDEFVFTFLDGHMLVLVHHPSEEALRETTAALLQMLEQNRTLVHGVGISGVSGGRQLEALRQQCEEALWGQFYYENQFCFFYGKPQGPGFQQELDALKAKEVEPFAAAEAYLQLCAKYRVSKERILASLPDHREKTDALQSCTRFLQLQALLTEQIATQSGAGPCARDNDFFQIQKYMQQHFMEEDLSLTDVEKVLHMSGRTISRLILEETGSHFKQYLNTLRIAHAKNLLLYSGLRINEIARAAGYHSVEHFSRLFSAEAGCSPSQFAEKKSK